MQNSQSKELNLPKNAKEDLSKNMSIEAIFYFISLIQDSPNISNFDEINDQLEKINNGEEEGILNGYEKIEHKAGENFDTEGIKEKNVSTESTEKKANKSKSLQKKQNLSKKTNRILRRNLKFRRIIKKRKVLGKHKLAQKKDSNNINHIKKDKKQGLLFKHQEEENIDFQKKEVSADDFKILEKRNELLGNKFEDMKNQEKLVKTPNVDKQNNDNYDAMSISSLGEKDNEFENKDNKENSEKDNKADNKAITSGQNQNGNQHNSFTEINENNISQDGQSEQNLIYDGTAENNDVNAPIAYGEITYDHTFEEAYNNMPGLGMNNLTNLLHIPDFYIEYDNFLNNENANQNDNDEEINFAGIPYIKSNH